jgi:oligo-1,6-glucosidase
MLTRRFSGMMGHNAGLCPQGVKPWIKVHENYKVNVVAAQKDPDSILAMWKHMLRPRKEHRDVLVYGRFYIYNMEHLTYVKSLIGMKILIVLNFSSGEQDLEIPPSLKGRMISRWSQM